jgi:mutual gliding-motility protein MglA
MAFVNFNAKEITAKIVYYGPGLGGKTSSLQYIYNNLPEENRGKMISLATDEDRTIYFDFLPLHLGKIQNFTVKVQLYTVPGQVRYNATRKLVLKGVDGIVFVADSQIHRKFSNIESYSNLEENLAAYHKNLKDVAHVIQYNKIDLPNIIRADELNQIINKYASPWNETCAITGIGIMDSLKAISKMVFAELSKKGITSKTYLLEKQTPAEELEIASEEEKEVIVADEPHELKDIEEPQEVFEEEEMEELSSDDVEIIHEDLKLIEPQAESTKSQEIADAFESDIIHDETFLEPHQLIIPDKEEFEEAKRGEIEFEPEHFELSDEAPVAEIKKAVEPAKSTDSFEELEDINAFHELETAPPEAGIPAEEEDAFSEFLDEAIPSNESPTLESNEIKTQPEEQLIMQESVFEESKPEDILSEPLITNELLSDEIIHDELIQEDKPSELFAKAEEEKQQDLFSEEIIEKVKPVELLSDSKQEAIVPEAIISEEIPHEDLISDEMLEDFRADGVQFEEPADVLEAVSLEVHPLEIPEIAIEPISAEKPVPEIMPAAEPQKPVNPSSPSFSYSTIIDNENIRESLQLLEHAVIEANYDTLYQHASHIFSEITALLNNKYKFCDPKSQAELLWLIGIQPNDYYLFIKNLAALKDNKKGKYIYYIHNFLTNLLFKSQIIPLE